MSQTSDSLKVSCPGCSSRMRVPPSASGKKVRCPKCEQAFRIPSAENSSNGKRAAAKPATVKSATARPADLQPAITKPTARKQTDSVLAISEEPLRFACDACSARLKAPPTAVGKRIKCSKCGSIMRVPDPDAPKEPIVEDDNFEDLMGGDALLSELAASESSGSVVEGAGPVCPSCATQLQRGVIMCTECGYNLSTGTRAPAVAMETESSTKNGRGFSFGISLGWHPFMTGTLLSIGGAIIGAIVWFLIAYNFQYEFGYIAWGLGAMAGGGMAVGYRDANPFAGLVAAIVAFFGIILAKIAVFATILLPILSVAQTGMNTAGVNDVTPRDRLVTAIVDQKLGDSDDSWLDEEDDDALAAFEAQIQDARDDAQREVDRMNDEEVQRELLVLQLVDDKMDRPAVWQKLGQTDTEAEYDAAYAELEAEARTAAEEETAQLSAAEISKRLHDKQCEELAGARADLAAVEQDLDDDSSEYDQIYQRELTAARSLSPEEVDTQLAEAHKAQLAALTGVVGAMLVIGFFVTMFGLYDILFFILALATAFSVGKAGANWA